MKAIYNSISEDLIDLIESSEISNRKIKYISLTEKEYDSLQDEYPREGYIHFDKCKILKNRDKLIEILEELDN